MQNYVKQEQVGLNSKELDSQKFRDEVYKLLQSLNAKLPSASYQTFKDSNNTALFTSGEHKAFSPKDQDFIDSIPGAYVSVPVSLDANCKIKNMYFKDTVSLSATSVVIFDSCKFSKPISIVSGGKSQFIGCSFIDTAYVDNAGAVANIYINGCIRTPTVHINVVVISEIEA